MHSSWPSTPDLVQPEQVTQVKHVIRAVLSDLPPLADGSANAAVAASKGDSSRIQSTADHIDAHDSISQVSRSASSLVRLAAMQHENSVLADKQRELEKQLKMAKLELELEL